MPRKLRSSLTALAAITLIAAAASDSAQAQGYSGNYRANDRLRNAGPSSQSKALVGRNDGYVQQSTQGAANRFHPTKQYGVQVGRGERTQTNGLATTKGSKPAAGTGAGGYQTQFRMRRNAEGK